MDWDPNAPAKLGLDWAPRAPVGNLVLDSQVKAFALSVDQSVSEAIVDAEVYLKSIPVRLGIYALEVYDNESAIPLNITTSDARPNEDISIGNWREEAGGGTTIYSQIDETTLNTADSIYLAAGNTTPSTYRGRFNTAAFVSLTGKRILSVGVHIVGRVGVSAQFEAGITIDGTDYVGPMVHGPVVTPTAWSYTWYYNPSTRKPWTIADVTDFDATDGWYATGRTENGWTLVQFYQVFLRVTYVDENRLAVGTIDDSFYGSGVDAGWNVVALTTPTGGTWTKDASGRHLYLLRRISSVGSVVLPYLAAPTSPEVASGWTPTVDPTYGYVTAMGDDTHQLFAVVPRTVTPTESVDSQPYSRLYGASVSAGLDAEGELSGATSAAYGLVKFQANPVAGGPTADLLVKVKRRSDNQQLGGTYTLTVAEALAVDAYESGGWREFTVQLPQTATLAAATQYYLEFSSTTPTANPWYVLAVDTQGVGNDATYTGTTDRATLDGVESDSYDLVATLSTVPTAPATFQASLDWVAMDSTVCGADEKSVVVLSWDDTSLAGLFVRYEIERSTAGGDYHPVAKIVTESVNTWTDEEAARGKLSSYRIRVVRSDGAISAWSLATTTRPAGGRYVELVSNYDPTLSCAFEYDPSVSWDNHDAEHALTVPIYGRNRQRGYQGQEVLGVTQSMTLVVAGVTHPPANGSLDAFAALRDIAKADLPYVCVLDYEGGRIYAQLRVPSPSHSNPGQVYVAGIEATEVSDVPFPVEIA